MTMISDNTVANVMGITHMVHIIHGDVVHLYFLGLVSFLANWLLRLTSNIINL